MEERLPIEGLFLTRSEWVLHLRSERPLCVLSSAVVGGGRGHARHVINLHVDKNYDCPNPSSDLEAAARELGIREPFVGLMTAARLGLARVVVEKNSHVGVAAIVTVGISRPVSAGVTEAARLAVGTINIILAVSALLSPAAGVNAVITATEAKTLALVEAGVRAPHGGLASGTGTDSVVVASLETGSEIEYAGPVSPVGALIARAVRRAVKDSL